MFNLKNVVITGGNFVASSDLPFQSRAANVQRGLQILQENICPGAFHDSADRYDPPKCLPHTREAALTKILDWTKDRSSSKKLFLWLYGPAGVGKSAIAQTIAETCEKEGLLVGAFFFSRTAVGRNDETRLIATIAYQITLSIPDTRDSICLAFERDPSIVSRTLVSQMQTLIVDPLVKSWKRHHPQNRTLLIIIDGLDECSDSQAQKNILQALGILVKAPIPVVFLVASRPEYWIRDLFNVDPLSSQVLGVALDDTYRPEDDLKKYFYSKFEDIKASHPLKDQLTLLWPSSLAIEKLVNKSSGQFIYASTVMNYISSDSHRPQDRLDVVLGVSPSVNDAPFANLDALYTHILQSSSNIMKVLDILGLLILDPYVRKRPKNVHTIRFMNALFDYKPGELQLYLRDLFSVVYVPTPDEDPNYLDQTIRIYHASFVDFVLDRSRAGPFFLDSTLYHSRLGRFWIQLSSKTLTEDEFSEEIPAATIRALIIISHCIRSIPGPDLVVDLRNIDLIADLFPSDAFYLDEPGHPVVRFTKWLAKYDKSPRKLCADGPDYQISQIDNWLSNLIKGYPHSLKTYLPALLSFPTYMARHPREIYLLLTSLENPYHSVQIDKSDGENFRFKRSGTGTFDVELLEMMSVSLSDKLRSGRFHVTPEKIAHLAHAISRYLFDRSEAIGSSDSEGEPNVERYPFRRLPGAAHEESDDEVEESEISVALTFLPLILEQSPCDAKLAMILRDHALQFSSTDSYYAERRDLAIASLRYIRKCRLPLEHRHELEWMHDMCILCSEASLTGESEADIDATPCDPSPGNAQGPSNTFKSLSRFFKKRH